MNKKLLRYLIGFLVILQFQIAPYLMPSQITVPHTNIKVNPRILSFLNPPFAGTQAFSSASATLGNSRMSFRGGISGAHGSGLTIITLQNDYPDVDNDNIFPKDTVCFTNWALSGCSEQTTYTVGSQISTDKFSITAGLGAALVNDDIVVATQSGSLNVRFTTASEIPSTGSIVLTIPAHDTEALACDGMPDTADAVANNGFDLGPTASRIAAGDISVTGCTDGDWVATETVTCATGGNDHKIIINRQNTACSASSTINITIDSDPGLRNPAPRTSGHTQGTADIYTLDVTSYSAADGGGSQLDTVDIKVAPIEGVLVSATIDETLSFVIGSVAASATNCGSGTQTTDVDTTAAAVNFNDTDGSYSINSDTFVDAQQSLAVSTNASSGYTVTVVENDQMGKDGVTCPGKTADEDDSCIPDTTCLGGSCSEVQGTEDDWETASDNGFGISMGGSGTTFKYNVNTGNCQTDGVDDFCAHQIPDAQSSEAPLEIMKGTGAVATTTAYVCYRLSVSSIQPAGLYYNKVTYTANASF